MYKKGGIDFCFFCFFLLNGLKSCFVYFVGVNMQCGFYIYNENFIVFDCVGFCGFYDGLNCLIDYVVCNNNFQFYFGNIVNGIFCVVVNFGVI